MKDEDWRIGRRRVQLIQCRQPPLRELECGPAPNNTNPLGWRRALRLLAQHPHGLSERGNPVPTELEIVVKPGADDVEM